MITIHKFTLDKLVNKIDIPNDFKVLLFHEQNGELRIWIELDNKAAVSKKTFILVPTGGEVFHNYTFVGSAVIVNILATEVWHCYYLIK